MFLPDGGQAGTYVCTYVLIAIYLPTCLPACLPTYERLPTYTCTLAALARKVLTYQGTCIHTYQRTNVRTYRPPWKKLAHNPRSVAPSIETVRPPLCHTDSHANSQLRPEQMECLHPHTEERKEHAERITANYAKAGVLEAGTS